MIASPFVHIFLLILMESAISVSALCNQSRWKVIRGRLISNGVAKIVQTISCKTACIRRTEFALFADQNTANDPDVALSGESLEKMSTEPSVPFNSKALPRWQNTEKFTAAEMTQWWGQTDALITIGTGGLQPSHVNVLLEYLAAHNLVKVKLSTNRLSMSTFQLAEQCQEELQNVSMETEIVESRGKCFLLRRLHVLPEKLRRYRADSVIPIDAFMTPSQSSRPSTSKEGKRQGLVTRKKKKTDSTFATPTSKSSKQSTAPNHSKKTASSGKSTLNRPLKRSSSSSSSPLLFETKDSVATSSAFRRKHTRSESTTHGTSSTSNRSWKRSPRLSESKENVGRSSSTLRYNNKRKSSEPKTFGDKPPSPFSRQRKSSSVREASDQSLLYNRRKTI